MLIASMLILGASVYTCAQLFSPDSANTQPAPVEPDPAAASEERGAEHVSVSKDGNPIDENVDLVSRGLVLSASSAALAGAGIVLASPLGLLSVPLLAVAIVPFYRRAYIHWTKERRIGVALVDTVCLSGMLLAGYFFTTAVAISLVYASKKLLTRTKKRSHENLTNLFKDLPGSVFIEHDGVEVEIPIDKVEVGATVVVDSGSAIPVDGVIKRGMGLIDERTLTGESQPIEKGPDERVFAQTMLLHGRIHVVVERAGRDSVAAQLVTLLNDTESFSSSIQSRGEKIADQGALPTLLVFALTLPLLGPSSALAVLCASFGYHMRYAAPISAINFLKLSAEQGFLVKDGRALEQLSGVDTFLLDKTGTLTEEISQVETIYSFGEWEQAEVLTLAAAAEHKQEHPIAQAIRAEADARGLVVVQPRHEATRVTVGFGLQSEVGGAVLMLGSRRLMESEGIHLPSAIQEIETRSHQLGQALVFVAVNGELAGVIELQPKVRPGARALVEHLHELGYEVAIISGDHDGPTRGLAENLGVDEYRAQVLPQEKADIVRDFQARGRTVCFIGDGINDGLALKVANVGISMRGASSIAVDAADIVMSNGDLDRIQPLLALSRALDENLRRSTFLTVAPGIVAIAGVYFLHFGLMTALILYNGSLILAVSNAMLPLIDDNIRKKPESVSGVTVQAE